MLDIDYKEFNKNLTLTQHYCARRLAGVDQHTVTVLRSINPEYKGRKMFSFFRAFVDKSGKEQTSLTEWGNRPYDDGILEYLFERQLSEKEQAFPKATEGTFKGEIMIFRVDWTLFDGAAEVESEGFLDEYNCPPIDTWFFLAKDQYSRLLFAWVPEQFYSGVNNGILVNPEDCICWFSEYKTDFEKFEAFHKKRNILSQLKSLLKNVLKYGEK